MEITYCNSVPIYAVSRIGSFIIEDEAEDEEDKKITRFNESQSS